MLSSATGGDNHWASSAAAAALNQLPSLSLAALFRNYTTNLAWSLFLTSTAIHAVLLITSPLQAVYKWYRRKSSDSDTPVPYVCACAGSLLWLRYAVFISDLKLVLLQTYAVIMQSFFLFSMLLYRSKKRRLLRWILLLYSVVLLLFLAFSFLPPEIGKRASGLCASGAQIAGSFVCPYLIYKAVSLGRIDFIPLAPVAFTWVMEAHAIVYSLGVNDVYLLAANACFFCMDGCLLSMFFILPTSSGGSHKVSLMKRCEGDEYEPLSQCIKEDEEEEELSEIGSKKDEAGGDQKRKMSTIEMPPENGSVKGALFEQQKPVEQLAAMKTYVANKSMEKLSGGGKKLDLL